MSFVLISYACKGRKINGRVLSLGDQFMLLKQLIFHSIFYYTFGFSIAIVMIKLSGQFLIICLLAVFFIACEEEKANEKEAFNDNLDSFNQTIDKVDKTMDLVDNMQLEVETVENERAIGKIDDEEALRRLEAINRKYSRNIAKMANENPAMGMPLWAQRSGLTEPRGLDLDLDFSQETSEKNPDEGFNSVVLVYRGSYEQCMQEAQRIASEAGIPLSSDYEAARQLSEKYGTEMIKGAAYMNFELGSEVHPKYNIAITVDEDGTLTITATDAKKLSEQFSE